MPIYLLAASWFRRLADVPPLYLVLWCGLVALGVLLVVLMRSRWGQSRTLHKCAVLSLLVHVMLACLAMTVRIVVGDGGADSGPPIRVRLVDDVPTPVPVAKVPPPPLFEPEPPELNDAEPETAPAEEEMVLEAPALLDEPPVADLEEAPTEDTEMVADVPASPPTEVTSEAPNDTVAVEEFFEPESEQTALAAAPTEAEQAPPAPQIVEKIVPPPSPRPVVAATPPVAQPYVLRTDPNRLALVQEQGGSRDTEAAVAAALEWLAATQSSDGRWDPSRFGAGHEQGVLGQNRRGAGGNADTGISALALLAFLGAGHTHQEGQYRPTVRAGLEFLLRSQAADGNLSGPADLFARMYCHAMATFALGEALAFTDDQRLEPALERAVAYSMRAQNPATGGWRYRVGDTGDTSQLGWQMMSLWSAQQAGVEVSPQAWTGIDRFLRSVRRGRHGGLASYRPDGPSSTSMTAEAFYCRVLLDEMIRGGPDSESAREATEHLLASRPQRDHANLYYWYYATLALHHRRGADPRAEDAWYVWNSDLTTLLLDLQEDTGPEAGSWSPNTIWGGYGGRVYSTAMAALCLEVYYRYAPAAPPGQWIATRPGQQDITE